MPPSRHLRGGILQSGAHCASSWKCTLVVTVVMGVGHGCSSCKVTVVRLRASTLTGRLRVTVGRGPQVEQTLEQSPGPTVTDMVNPYSTSTEGIGSAEGVPPPGQLSGTSGQWQVVGGGLVT